jgi:hypothetical protein
MSKIQHFIDPRCQCSLIGIDPGNLRIELHYIYHLINKEFKFKDRSFSTVSGSRILPAKTITEYSFQNYLMGCNLNQKPSTEEDFNEYAEFNIVKKRKSSKQKCKKSKAPSQDRELLTHSSLAHTRRNLSSSQRKNIRIFINNSFVS